MDSTSTAPPTGEYHSRLTKVKASRRIWKSLLISKEYTSRETNIVSVVGGRCVDCRGESHGVRVGAALSPTTGQTPIRVRRTASRHSVPGFLRRRARQITVSARLRYHSPIVWSLMDTNWYFIYAMEGFFGVVALVGIALNLVAISQELQRRGR